MNAPRLGIVIPCYNEEPVLPETHKRLSQLLEQLIAANKIAPTSRVYFVDDGSRDKTWAMIAEFSTRDGRFGGVKLSRNCGHQRALLAGLLNASGDVLISLDADLQDDLGAISEMLDRHAEGHDIVYGVRSARAKDTFFKRATARFFYTLMIKLGVDIVYDHADYRLMSRRAVESLREFGEVNLFLRGIIPLIGFKAAIVKYERHERFAGESKYPLMKMLSFALDGITSFSVSPLRMIAGFGLTTCVLSIAMGLWIIFRVLLTGETAPGWASTVVPMYFLGGIQLLSIGILGEYVAKSYLETKRRPRFIVDTVL